MATVRKRKWTHNGKEAEAWVVNYTDQDGKRRQKTFDKKKEAEAYRIQAEGDVVRGVHIAESVSIKVADALREFLADADRRWKRGDIAGSTWRGNRARFVHLENRLGGRVVSTLTSEDFQSFVNYMRDDLKFAANTVLGIHGVCYAFCDFCVRKKWSRRNVLRDERLRLPKKQRRAAIPSRADITLLLDVVREWRSGQPLHAHVVQRGVVALGLFAGLRPGEAFGLQWEDVDFTAGVLRIRHSQSRHDGLKATKTVAGNRLIPITAPIMEALDVVARYRAYQVMSVGEHFRGQTYAAINWRLKAYWKKQAPVDPELLSAVRTGHVLKARNGRPLTPQSSNETWQALVRAAGLIDPVTGLAKFTPHALRHAAASLMIASGMPALNLKQVIGHSSVSTTYDIYGHLFPEDDRTRTVLDSIAASVGATMARQVDITGCK